MESKTVVYKNGHFYDKVTSERIKIKDGSELVVAASGNSFSAAPPVGKWPKNHPMNAAELEKEIELDPKIVAYKKIYDKGTLLYFMISLHGHHEFEVELLEDLYVYIPATQKESNNTEGKLYNCACEVKRNTSQSIAYFEKIIAKSLNEVYKNTFVHYFGNVANPACNALDRFYEASGQEERIIGDKREIEVKS